MLCPISSSLDKLDTHLFAKNNCKCDSILQHLPEEKLLHSHLRIKTSVKKHTSLFARPLASAKALL